MADFFSLTQRAALASHRLVGWIYWDPQAISNYEGLGIPNGTGYYIATRAASVGDAPNSAVTAMFGSIHPDFVAMSLNLCRTHTTFEQAAAARDAAVVAGLQQYVPEICDGLAELSQPLWAAATSLPTVARPLFASLLAWPRPQNQLLSAWLAINCIREWRGDTHWAIQATEEITGTMAGVLDGAWRDYPDDWLPRSRGATDEDLNDAIAALEARGLAESGRVTQAGVAYRQSLEDRLDRLCSVAWQALGELNTLAFLNLVEPVGERLLRRVDQTAGPNWMPAGRTRRRKIE